MTKGLNPGLLAALIALIYQVCVLYLPDFPVGQEVLGDIIVWLLGLLGLNGIKALTARYAQRFHQIFLADD